MVVHKTIYSNVHHSIFPDWGYLHRHLFNGGNIVRRLAGVATGDIICGSLFYIFAQGTLMGITSIITQLLGAKRKQMIFQ